MGSPTYSPPGPGAIDHRAIPAGGEERGAAHHAYFVEERRRGAAARIPLCPLRYRKKVEEFTLMIAALGTGGPKGNCRQRRPKDLVEFHARIDIGDLKHGVLVSGQNTCQLGSHTLPVEQFWFTALGKQLPHRRASSTTTLC